MWAQNGWITDLAAFAELADYAVSMIPTDIGGDRSETFVNDLGAVLTEFVDRTYYDKAQHLGQSGFDWIFQDPAAGGRQPHHFWFYVYSVFQSDSRTIATIGNFLYETLIANRGRGRSYQDFALGQEGVNLGVDLHNGCLPIEQVGAWIRDNLGPGGAAARTWDGPGSGFNKRSYALSLAVSSLFVPIPEGQQGYVP